MTTNRLNRRKNYKALYIKTLKKLERTKKLYRSVRRKYRKTKESYKKLSKEIKGKARQEIKVACILDTFSYECFKYECSLQQLGFNTWEQQIKQLKPDFVFVESAWIGIDGTWKMQLLQIDKKPNNEIGKLIHYCKRNGITTVFWNKEDPFHYGQFIETAKLFDVIFTTDEKCIRKYKRDVSHNRVYTLPFAAQPVIHNPINVSYKTKQNVAFAGAWYDNKTERKKDMNMILNPSKTFGLNIFDRMIHNTGHSYKFPVEYQSHIVGGLAYNDMVKAYKRYKVFLNVNSVKDSPTMFSRRVFELLACGTNVLSTYSVGIEKLFKDIVPLCFTEQDTKHYLSLLLNKPELSQRLSLLGLREVNDKHLYKHRFRFILNKISLLKNEDVSCGITVIACVTNPDLMANVLHSYAKQAWTKKELIIVIANKMHREAVNAPENDVTMIELQENTPLAECLNHAIEKAKYDFISVFNENDDYAPYFITDLAHAFNYTDADIVGKHTHFSYSRKTKTLALHFPDQEYRCVDYLCCSAMLAKRKVLNQVKFYGGKSESVFTNFLEDCNTRGFKLYSTDKYNYVNFTTSHPQLDEQPYADVTITEDFKSLITVDSKDGFLHTLSFNQLANESFESTLDDYLEMVANSDAKQIYFMFTGTTYLQEHRLSRPMYLTKELLKNKVPVCLSFWRWNKDDPLPVHSDPRLFQSPIDLTLKHMDRIVNYDFKGKEKIFIIFFPHVVCARLVNVLHAKGWKTVYDVMDDWKEFHKVGKANWFNENVENYIINNSEIITAVSKPLLHKIQTYSNRDRVFLSPNAVDSNYLTSSGIKAAPRDGKPIIGYVGHLTDAWFDWKAILTIAEQQPTWQFQIIGHSMPKHIQLKSNISYMGPKNYREIKEIAKGWRAAIIPFTISTLSDAVDPIKVYEYLALGLPVVSFHMPQIADYPGVYISNSVGEFKDNLKRAFSEPINVEEIEIFLHRNHWEDRVEELNKWVKPEPSNSIYQILKNK